MFYQKKKKEYSEVSENKLNINSEYFNIFQNELKKLFPNENNIKNHNKDSKDNKDNKDNKDSADSADSVDSADNGNNGNNGDVKKNKNKNKDKNKNKNKNIPKNPNGNICKNADIKISNDDIIEKNHKIGNKMVNSNFKNIELNNGDIFFINKFIEHIKTNNK
jgi:hypothetical protein